MFRMIRRSSPSPILMGGARLGWAIALSSVSPEESASRVEPQELEPIEDQDPAAGEKADIRNPVEHKRLIPRPSPDDKFGGTRRRRERKLSPRRRVLDDADARAVSDGNSLAGGRGWPEPPDGHHQRGEDRGDVSRKRGTHVGDLRCCDMDTPPSRGIRWICRLPRSTTMRVSFRNFTSVPNPNGSPSSPTPLCRQPRAQADRHPRGGREQEIPMDPVDTASFAPPPVGVRRASMSPNPSIPVHEMNACRPTLSHRSARDARTSLATECDGGPPVCQTISKGFTVVLESVPESEYVGL